MPFPHILIHTMYKYARPKNAVIFSRTSALYCSGFIGKFVATVYGIHAPIDILGLGVGRAAR